MMGDLRPERHIRFEMVYLAFLFDRHSTTMQKLYHGMKSECSLCCFPNLNMEDDGSNSRGGQKRQYFKLYTKTGNRGVKLQFNTPSLDNKSYI